MMKHRWGAALAVALSGTLCNSGAFAGPCVAAFRFTSATTDLQGTTRRDQPCTIFYGTRSDIVGYRVVQRPRFGTLGSAGHSGGRFLTAYKPNAGYVGSDEFTVQVDYAPRSTHVERSTVVHVQMAISP